MDTLKRDRERKRKRESVYEINNINDWKKNVQNAYQLFISDFYIFVVEKIH